MKEFVPDKELKKKEKKFNVGRLLISSAVLVVATYIGLSHSEYAIKAEDLVVANAKVGTFSKGGPAVGVVEGVTDTTKVAKDDPDKNPRYIGKNPDNYVTFNDETWRIIGVFNTYVCNDSTTGKLDGYKSDSNCKQEKLLKIIRNDFLSTSMAWDTNNANDWSTATSQIALNGDYFGRTGTYASTGLSPAAQSMVANAVWTLGGPGSDYTSKGTPQYFYTAERGDTVPSGRPKAFVGHVGLMFPSDYGYATGGSTSTSRTTCLAKEMFNWNSLSNCYNNDWLFNTNYPWTLSPRSDASSTVFGVGNGGYVGGARDANDTNGVRPVVYLKSSVQIVDGTGKEDDPYKLGYPRNAVEVVEGIMDTNQIAKDDPNSNPRYIGKDPDNYVTFNDETWRIIGVFNTYVCDGTSGVLDNYKDSSACKQEKLLKIIKSEFLSTSMRWDSGNGNDWSKATLQTALNGEYFSKSGSYTSTGLSPAAQSMVANVVWTLGGTANYNSSTAEMFYTAERGKTVYSGRPKAFVGHVGLMFPSDYGYATGGSTSTSRTMCLAKKMYYWYDLSDCYNNDWLYNSSTTQWTLPPRSDGSFSVFYVSDYGDVSNHGADTLDGVRPVVYLKSSVQIVDGNGKVGSPYKLSA